MIRISLMRIRRLLRPELRGLCARVSNPGARDIRSWDNLLRVAQPRSLPVVPSAVRSVEEVNHGEDRVDRRRSDGAWCVHAR